MAIRVLLTFSEIEEKLNNWEYDPHQGLLTVRTSDGETYKYRDASLRELKEQIPVRVSGESSGFRQFLQSRIL